MSPKLAIVPFGPSTSDKTTWIERTGLAVVDAQYGSFSEQLRLLGSAPVIVIENVTPDMVEDVTRILEKNDFLVKSFDMRKF